MIHFCCPSLIIKHDNVIKKTGKRKRKHYKAIKRPSIFIEVNTRWEVPMKSLLQFIVINNRHASKYEGFII
jgi:hypothetical protein